ncbi:MAG: metallophosphoesterase family protein [Anaerolineae bacterium]|nr:metallophosphoesterase family protein [Anaerolineae bacterium]
MLTTYLPPHISPDQVQACLGLLSDTHMPSRWPRLHDTLSHIFADVDLILHAGDVGELWVLDELSRIAPVVAVHGNDEPADTPQMLPEKEIVTVAGQRILLWHGHYTDRVDELESRRTQTMLPKLERIARHGQRVGAKFVHFGHWHIPLICEIEGVTLVNAGAFASGNLTTRQLIQTVALLFVLENGRFHITHIDVNSQELHQPQDVVALDFLTALRPYTGSILSPELQALAPQFQHNPETIKVMWQLAPSCWWGGKEMITREDVEKEYGDNLK